MCLSLGQQPRLDMGNYLRISRTNTGHMDNYLSTLQQAYTLLVHWKQDTRHVVRMVVGGGGGWTN
jgi:hypothetical protein